MSLIRPGVPVPESTPESCEYWRNVHATASALAEKMSVLTWRDRDVGLQEWRALVNALNAGSPSKFLY